MLWALAYTTFGLVYWRLTRTLGCAGHAGPTRPCCCC